MQIMTNRAAVGSDGWFKQGLAETAINVYGNTSAGAGAVTVIIEASEDGVTALQTPIGTVTLTLGTTVVADGFVMKARWNFIRARVASISGTGTTVNAETSLKDR